MPLFIPANKDRLHFLSIFLWKPICAMRLSGMLDRGNDLPDTHSNRVEATRWRRKITVWQKHEAWGWACFKSFQALL